MHQVSVRTEQVPEPQIAEILAGQQGVAGVQQLLSGAFMAHVLRPALSSLLEQPDSLLYCRLQRAKFKPGRKLTGYYDLSFPTPGGGAAGVRHLAVTWALPNECKAPMTVLPVDGQPSEATLLAEAGRRGLVTPFQHLTLTAPEWGMTIQISPLDPRYPQLIRLSDPQYIQHLLARYTKPTVGHEAAATTGYQATSLRYRPGQRHVLRYDSLSPGATETGAVFAKLYPDESGKPFFSLFHQIADWLESETSGATALRPHAYLPADRTLLYPWTRGVPFSHLLRNPTHTLTPCLTQIGATLRALHHTPATVTQGLPTLAFAAESKGITRTCEHIHRLLPAVGQTIQTLLQRAQECYLSLAQEALTLIHGDFKADHILVAPAQLTLIDFDSCALADPAFDIGKFLADLTWWYATYRKAGITQAQHAFLTGYNLPPTHPRLLRARLWAMLILIKMTAHRFPLFDPDWPVQTTDMVTRSMAIGFPGQSLRSIAASG